MSGGRVALVCMPWGSIETPSTAMGLLKRYARAAGFEAELHYLNVRFAEQIGLKVYERIAQGSYFQTEWFFSQALFGPHGTGELHNGWRDLRADPEAQTLVDSITRGIGLSDTDCEHLAGREVPAFIDDCVDAVDWSRYMAIGFTTTFAQSLGTLLLARRIKQRHPEVVIMMGGANVDSEMGVEMMRAFDWIDFVVHGEAEHNFAALLHAIAARDSSVGIPGVSARQAGTVVRGDQTLPPMTNMNDVPAPDYTDFLAEMDRTGFRTQLPMTLWYESSRGCWWGAKHHCTFCGLNHNGMTYRKKDAARVYDEIVDLANYSKCLRLAATDNILAPEFFAELLPRLAALDSDLQLFYEVKANLRRDQLQLMARAGIRTIQPGIESFNSRLLQLMRKGATAIQNIQLLKWCRELGIQTNYNILYGFPQEAPDDYADLPTIFRMLGHLDPPIAVGRVVIERFSPYFFDQERFQLRYEPWSEYRYVYPAGVDLAKIAYFFRGSWADQAGDPEDYVAAAKSTHAEWAAAAANQRIVCSYEKGPDYVRVHDNRPRGPKQFPWSQTTDLDEPQSALFLYCDENHAFPAIVTMMQTRFGDDVTDGMVRVWLDDLVDRWLMFREGDRYLTLPVRKKHMRI